MASTKTRSSKPHSRSTPKSAITKNAAAGATKLWTAMFFLAADNDLGDLLEGKVFDLSRVATTSVTNVDVQYDGPHVADTVRSHVLSDPEEEAPQPLGELNGGDIETLIDFAAWSRSASASQRRCLIIWSHGTSVDPAEPQARAGSRSRFARAQLARLAPVLQRTMFPVTALKERKIGVDNTTGPHADYTGPDMTSSDYLSNIELKEALTRIHHEQPIDILGLEACLMNTIEVAYQFRGSVECLVASQSSIPRKGWSYDVVLQAFQDNQADVEDVAENIVRGARFIPVPLERNVTLSALRISKVEEVKKSIDTLANSLRAALPNPRHRGEIVLAHHRAQPFIESETIDLIDFCQLLQGLDTDSTVKDAAADVEAKASSLIIRNFAAGVTAKRANGVSISFPTRNYISPTYQQLDFVTGSSWLTFLRAYHALVYPLGDDVAPTEPAPEENGERERVFIP